MVHNLDAFPLCIPSILDIALTTASSSLAPSGLPFLAIIAPQGYARLMAPTPNISIREGLSTSTTIPPVSKPSKVLSTSTIVAIAIFGTITLLIAANFLLCMVRRRRSTKAVPVGSRRPSYSPFRTASQSSANEPLAYEKSLADSDSRKSSMFARPRSGSVLSVYATLPHTEAEADEQYRARRISAQSLIPVHVSPPSPVRVSEVRQSLMGAVDGPTMEDNNDSYGRPRSLSSLSTVSGYQRYYERHEDISTRSGDITVGND